MSAKQLLVLLVCVAVASGGGECVHEEKAGFKYDVCRQRGDSQAHCVELVGLGCFWAVGACTGANPACHLQEDSSQCAQFRSFGADCDWTTQHTNKTTHRRLQEVNDGFGNQCLTSQVVDLTETVEILQGQVGSLRDEVDLLKSQPCCESGGAPSSCADVNESGTYTLSVEGTDVQVYCEKVAAGGDSGSWVKILQVHNAPIDATKEGYGDISSEGVNEAAKLADAIINIMAPADTREYRLQGSLTTKKVWIKQDGLFDMDSQGIGLAAVKPFGIKECADYDSCGFQETSHNTIDSLVQINSVDNDCDRYFIDYSGHTADNRCYNGGSNADEVCFAAGVLCGNHKLIPTVTLWLKVD